jgi:hypothetical protein
MAHGQCAIGQCGAAASGGPAPRHRRMHREALAATCLSYNNAPPVCHTTTRHLSVMQQRATYLSYNAPPVWHTTRHLSVMQQRATCLSCNNAPPVWHTTRHLSVIQQRATCLSCNNMPPVCHATPRGPAARNVLCNVRCRCRHPSERRRAPSRTYHGVPEICLSLRHARPSAPTGTWATARLCLAQTLARAQPRTHPAPPHAQPPARMCTPTHCTCNPH